MRIGIIDADLIDGGTKHPNLACMKLSGFHREAGHSVSLVTGYDRLDEYDHVYVSKVFSFTKTPEWLPRMGNVTVGGTGFFWKTSPPLPDEVEHHMPDYHLYDAFVRERLDAGDKRSRWKDYLDYSIGFTTRGCFRKCGFCVNEKYDRVQRWAPVSEFLDPARKYIYLWDDNILAYPKWREVFDELNAAGKPFQFRQGMDIRLMSDEKARVLSASRYHHDFIFAFDHIGDRELIERKLSIWERHCTKIAKLYILCGFESQDEKDVADTFERVRILMSHRCLPYIMRHEKYLESPWRGVYIALAKWCNQPAMFKKKTFREYCELVQSEKKTPGLCAPMRYMTDFEKAFPDIAAKYFDMRWRNG